MSLPRAKIRLLLLAARWVLAVSALPVLLPVAVAQAQNVRLAMLSADIPAQPLAEALAVFARQTGLHVVYVSHVVRNQSSHSVPAGLSVEDALARLLEGTGLRFEFLTAHSVRILTVEPGPPQSPLALREDLASLPEVMVTGSRIPVPADITATSPMQIVTAEDIQLTGHTDIVDVISALPQMILSAGADYGNHSNPGNTAGGVSTADLRGLRPQRTVVLINGRRLGVGDPNTTNPTPAPDLDQIPLAMVERVEVLTGGASATYGSDAIAGVVNFILKDHVQGVQLDAQYGFAQHTQHNAYLQSQEAAAGFAAPSGSSTDGFRRTVSVLAGTAFHNGDGQVTGYFTYQGQDPVRGSDRDFSACTALSTNEFTGVVTQSGFTCLGSFNSNLIVTAGGAGTAYSVVGRELVPWPAAGSSPSAFFNYAPYLYAQRQDTRYQTGLLAHLTISPAARPYFEFAFMEDETRDEIAPSGLFLGSGTLTADGGYLVNCSNPLLSAQEAAILCTSAQIAADAARPGSVSADVLIGRRNVEGGPRSASYQHRNYRAVAGVDGKLGEAWSYDAYALYYYTSLSQAYGGYLSSTAINNALQVTTDASGRPVCISGGTCVPYNIFTAGSVSAQQLAYLYDIGTDGGANSEQIVEADLTGHLARYGLIAPWAHDGLALNVGLAHRTETLRFAPDAVEQSGDMSGFGVGVVALDKRESVDEAYLEIRAPLAQEQPLARDLTLDAGYRHSLYSTTGATNTYKFDLQFAPVPDLRLRAAFDRVVRAPSLIELYTPLAYSVSQLIVGDPCAPTDRGATHAAASLEACKHTGVSATQYGNGFGPAAGGTDTIPQCAPQGCDVVTGGNPALSPETANTWSLGVTFIPTAVPGLLGSLDYFRIRLRGEIGAVPESVTLQQCLATGDPVLCGEIVRGPAGTLSGASVAGGGYIRANAVNTGAALVSGVDLQASYRRPLGRWGALVASLSGTWLEHNASTPYRSAPSFDCAGLFGDTCLNGSVNPTWRHDLRLSWETPWKLLLSAQWRFIGRTGFDNNSSQTALQNQEYGFFDPLLTHIPSYSYLDLSGVWTPTRRLQVRLGIDNVFDKDPPFIPGDISSRAGGLNTFPTYDVLGRDVFLALRATF